MSSFQRGFLHLPLSVWGLRRATLQPRLQVSSPGKPNKPTRLILLTCSSYTKRLISNDTKKQIQRSYNTIFTCLFPSSCCQCPCWGAPAPLVVMWLNLAWQQCLVHVCRAALRQLWDLQLPLCLMNPPNVNLYMYSRRMTWGWWVAS